MNCNQFLQTSRTINFLINKDKATIPDFEHWHAEHVVNAWRGDEVMSWGKEARNYIEKEGDLDVASELSVTLIYSYHENRDISLNCERSDLLGATIRHLIRRAEKQLPTGIADASVLRIRRRWVANTLPNQELLHALAYIYARQRRLASNLATYLGFDLAKSIPEAADIDDVHKMPQSQIRYIKLSDRRISSLASHIVRKDEKYQAPPWLQELANERNPSKGLPGLELQVDFHAKMAEGTFNQFGNHVGMMWMYDDAGMAVDYQGFMPEDQATKFIYWRTVADRISYLRPASLVWISEIWLRGNADDPTTPVRKLPIRGEGLQVIGIDKTGAIRVVHWTTVRDTLDGKPRLVRGDVSEPTAPSVPNFLMPVQRAFERLYGKAS